MSVTYLEAINNADWSGESVASQAVVVASFSKTTTHAITHVVVDDIPDNQSRRKDKLGSITSDRAISTRRRSPPEST